MANVQRTTTDGSILRARSVMVTGATRGIGFALVREMLNMPSTIEYIFASYRSLDSEAGQSLLELSHVDPKLILVQMDITDETSIRAAFIMVQTRIPNLGLHLLINNAGIGEHDTFFTATSQSMEKFYKTNAIGPMLVTQTFLPLLRAGRESNHTKGRSFKVAVVNLSSQAASISSPRINYFSYGCSKAALNMATKCMSIELKREEIVVIPIHPGSVKTSANPGGSMSCESATEQILKVICDLQLGKSGKFVNYKGSELPW